MKSDLKIYELTKLSQIKIIRDILTSWNHKSIELKCWQLFRFAALGGLESEIGPTEVQNIAQLLDDLNRLVDVLQIQYNADQLKLIGKEGEKHD